MADKKISQLDSITSVNSDAVFPLSQTESGSLKTFKGTVEQIGDYIAKTQDHSTLNTVSKKIIGAINEILASGIGDIEGTSSGSVASFDNGGDNIPVKSLVAEIVASQAGSGTPSPSNPRAISGYTDVVIKNDVQGTTEATYTISLGSTVYMGTLNVTTGVLTVTHAYQLFDGSESWNYSSSDTRQRVFVPIAGGKGGSINLIGNIIEPNPTPTNNYPEEWKGAFNNNATPSLLIGVPSTITSAQDFKDLIANTNLQVVYELSTPVVINLTPTEVLTLLGENNIYANSGDVTVEYFNEDASQFNDLIETIITSSSSDYHVYSTNEKVVGRWIDGKPIYEKTFTNIAVQSSLSQLVDDSVSYGTLIDGSINIANGVGFAYVQDNDIFLRAYVSSNKLYVAKRQATDWAGSSYAFIYVKYTKSTD